MNPTAKITVQALIQAPIAKVWQAWTTPDDIKNWNNASPDWHTPKAENDLKVGGKFLSRMEAKDGSVGFDFAGVYTAVEQHKLIAYKMEDQREVAVAFIEKSPSETEIIETFDAETENTAEMQKQGWQSILNNFKSYVEGN